MFFQIFKYNILENRSNKLVTDFINNYCTILLNLIVFEKNE